MYRQKHFGRIYVSKLMRAASCVLVLSAVLVPCFGQSKLSLAQIRELGGEEIARGRNLEPATDLKLLSYHIEALTLPQQVKVKIEGKKSVVTKAWRITITGEQFRVGAMPAVLLIDDQPVAIGLESPDLTSLSFLVFNPRFIHNGATMAVTYDGDLLVDSHEPDPDVIPSEIELHGSEGVQKHVLPEKMRIRRR